MGGAIAERLLREGVILTVYDRDPTCLARAGSAGAVVAGSAREVALVSETVFTCLPTVAIASDVALREIAGAAGVRFHVELSTIGPAAATELDRELAKTGIGYIDAAVSGGAAAALTGDISLMVSGADAAVDAVAPLLDCISRRIFRIGARPGQAQAMKLVNNLLAAANMATSFEALAIGTSFGIAPETIVDVVNASSGKSTGLVDRRVAAILSRRFDSGPKIALLAKDIELAFDQAEQCGFPLTAAPSLTGMAELWRRAMAQGMAGDDVSALIRVVERAAGLEVAATRQGDPD